LSFFGNMFFSVKCDFLNFFNENLLFFSWKLLYYFLIFLFFLNFAPFLIKTAVLFFIFLFSLLWKLIVFFLNCCILFLVFFLFCKKTLPPLVTRHHFSCFTTQSNNFCFALGQIIHFQRTQYIFSRKNIKNWNKKIKYIVYILLFYNSVKQLLFRIWANHPLSTHTIYLKKKKDKIKD